MAGPKGMPASVRRKGFSQVENPGKIFLRLMKYIWRDYWKHYLAVMALIFVSVLANVQGTLFIRNLIDEYIEPMLLDSYASSLMAAPDFTPLAMAIARVGSFYAVGVAAGYAYNRILVKVTQGTLRNFRNDLFSHMEKLPISYFDSHSHGDIMSVYTNDADTLRQMISQSMPQIFSSLITIISVFISMIFLSVHLTAVTLIMVALMLFVTKKLAGASGIFQLMDERPEADEKGRE